MSSVASTGIEASAQPTTAAVARSAGARSSYVISATCIAVITIMLAPLVAGFLSSIKTRAAASASPPTYLPEAISFENYIRVYEFQAGMPTYLFNSVAVAFLTIVFCLLLSIPAGYGLARFQMRGKEGVFLFLLAGMMIPYQALLTPLYMMFTAIGLANTYVGLAIVHTVIQLPFSIYLMRHSFEQVPRELEEAALIDGCTSWQALLRIFLPAVKAGIVTVILFAFIMSWNEFLAALIFMNKETQFTVPVWLTSVRVGRLGSVDWGRLQAGIMIAIVPCIAVYVLLQRYYVSGFTSGAIK